MIGKPSPATIEEQAEIRALRERADATGQQVGDTVAALAGKVAEANPGTLLRKKAAEAVGQLWVAARRPARRLAPAPAAGRPGLAVAGLTAGVLVIVTIAVVWQQRRHA